MAASTAAVAAEADTEVVAVVAAPPPKRENYIPRGGEGDGALQCPHACPIPLGRRELTYHPGGDGTPDPSRSSFCNNWHLCGVFWEDCEHKNLHVPTPPEVVTTFAGTIKAAQGS